MDFSPQVTKSHYEFNYDSKKRWISYWYQIQEVLNKKPYNLLEIGIGNKVVSDYLKKYNVNVITADIDESLNPDYVCSVNELSKKFTQNSFDVVLCAEVLEHIPFEFFEDSIREMHTVSNEYVVISLPHFKINFSISIKVPLVQAKNLQINIPYPKHHVFDGEHYWEIGKKGYSLKYIMSIMGKYFVIEKNYLVDEHPYHRLFVLKRRNDINV
jgi:predicted SAM-dependent methyltransferase